jgi:reverse gyrase
MNLYYHIGHLRDHIHSNEKKGQINFHLSAIEDKFKNGELNIDRVEVPLFRKIITRMKKYNKGYWIKRNYDYEILFLALKSIITNNS